MCPAIARLETFILQSENITEVIRKKVCLNQNNDILNMLEGKVNFLICILSLQEFGRPLL